jgi:hypothetical protein
VRGGPLGLQGAQRYVKLPHQARIASLQLHAAGVQLLLLRHQLCHPATAHV